MGKLGITTVSYLYTIKQEALQSPITVHKYVLSKGKRHEISTPTSVDIHCMAVAGHALTLKSKGQGHAGYACRQDCLSFPVCDANSKVKR